MRIVEKNLKDIIAVEADYIREDYNQEYLDMIGHAMDCGETFPEVIIDENNKIIEGRHTFREMEKRGLEKALFNVVPVAKDALEDAVRSTMGHTKTKLPLLPQDYIHTFKNLLLAGFQPKQIIEAYTKKHLLSSGRIKSYLMVSQGNIYSSKIGPALAMLRQGKSLPEISEKLSIGLDFLKKKVSEIEVDRKKQNKKQIVTAVRHFRTMNSRRFKSVKQGIDRDLRTLKNRWQTGFATTEDYKAALQEIENNIQKLLDMVEEKKRRFNKDIKI